MKQTTFVLFITIFLFSLYPALAFDFSENFGDGTQGFYYGECDNTTSYSAFEIATKGTAITTDVFDNVWYCLSNGDVANKSAVQESRDTIGNFNTNSSTQFLVNTDTFCIDANCKVSLNHIFSQDVRFDEDTVMSFYVKGDGGDTDEALFINGRASDGSLKFNLCISSTSACNAVAMPTPVCTSYASGTRNTSLEYVELDFGDVITDCGYTVDDNLSNVKTLSVEFVGFFDDLWFDDISITDLDSIEGNTFPKVNVSIDTTACANESTTGNLTLDISSYDADGDTILYALGFNTKISTRTVSYNDVDFFTKTENHEVKPLTVVAPRNCPIDFDKNNANDTVIDYVLKTATNDPDYIWSGVLSGFGQIYGPRYMLNLRGSSDCSASGDDFEIRMPDTIQGNFDYGTEFYDFDTVNETVNITISDVNQNVYANVQLLNQNDTIYFRVDEQAGFTSWINSSEDPDNGFGVQISTFPSDGNMTISFIVYDESVAERLTNTFGKFELKDSTRDPRRIIIRPSESIVQDGFTYTGIVEAPTFSSTEPYTIAGQTVGTYTMRLYYTDDVYYSLATDSGSFESKELSYTILSCDQIVATPDADVETLSTAFRSSFSSICSSMNGVKTGDQNIFWDWCNLLKILIIVTGLIMGTIFAIIFRFVSANMAFPAFLVFFGLTVYTGNLFIIEFSVTSKIVFAILIALGLGIFSLTLIQNRNVGGTLDG